LEHKVSKELPNRINLEGLVKVMPENDVVEKKVEKARAPGAGEIWRNRYGCNGWHWSQRQARSG
jgi:hypothetical protein